MKVLDLVKVYSGPIALVNTNTGFIHTEYNAKFLHRMYFNYGISDIKFKNSMLWCELNTIKRNITVDEALEVSSIKECVLISLPYKGESSAFLSSDIPPEYLSREISVLIEQEDLNIIILEI